MSAPAAASVPRKRKTIDDSDEVDNPSEKRPRQEDEEEKRLVLVEQRVLALSSEERKALLVQLQAQEKKEEEEEEEEEEIGNGKPTTAEFMRKFIKDANARFTKMNNGEEVDNVTQPDEAQYLWSRYTNAVVHWIEFRNIKYGGKHNPVVVFKNSKKDSPYGTYKVLAGDQSFDGQIHWPHTFVMLGPVMKAEYASMGEEGNYNKIGKDNGPEDQYGISYELTLTNEQYSSKVCDDEYHNPLANDFFDTLERLFEYTIRTLFEKGHFQSFREFIRTKISAENEKRKKDLATKDAAERKKDPTATPSVFEPELPPQTEEEWLDLLLRNYVNPMVTTNTDKNMRSINIKRSCYDKLKRDAKGNITGPDVDYVPRHTLHDVYIDAFNRKPANGKDMQRKEHVLQWYRPMRADELHQDATGSQRTFPYVKMDKAPVVKTGDRIAPLIEFNPYDWIGSKGGVTRHIFALIWHGRAGEVNDSPPTPCNPLLAIPMASPYHEDAAENNSNNNYGNGDLDDETMAAMVN